MKQGMEALDQGASDKAISSFSAAIQLNPKDAQAYLDRGRAYVRKADYDNDKASRDKAIADFDQAIALDPKNEKAFYYRAGSHYAKGFLGDKAEQQKAIADYTQAVELNPNDAEAWRMRGMAWRSVFDLQKQIADDTEAIRADPKDVAAYNDRAIAYEQLHEPDKALADYTTSIQVAPDSGTYENRASLYAGKKDYVSAVADLTTSTQIEPDTPMTWSELAELLATCPDAKVRDGKKAVAAATKACEVGHWSDPQALATLAAACAEAGDFDNAVKWQQKYIADPSIGATNKSASDRLALYQAHKPYHDDGSRWSN